MPKRLAPTCMLPDGKGFRFEREGQTLAWLRAAGARGEASLDGENEPGLPGISARPSAQGWTLELPAGARCWIDLPEAEHWYGQGSFVRQGFPLDRLSLDASPLMTWDNGPAGLSCIQEALWLTSNGLAVLVPDASEELLAGINPANESLLETWVSVFDAGPGARPLPAADPKARRLFLGARTALTIQLLFTPDLPAAFRAALPHLGHPRATPPPSMLAEPIWTTWAKYKDAISGDKVLEFAHAIRAHGYPGRTLEIDDRWQTAYGETDFDPARFPQPAELVAALDGLGFATTLWITPFLAEGAANTAFAKAMGYLVQGPDGQPCPVRWWRGEAYLLDLTQPEACDWWAGRMEALQRATGIAGYKFDAGEANFLPPGARTRRPIQRSAYSTLWAAFAATRFPYGEVRCGWHGQGNAILHRQWDKFSTWGEDNGLASVITGALALGLVGYPFVLPDMVGGNAYGNSVAPELMVRWTQACAPMLAIQFSIPPWELGEATSDLCRRYAELHVELAGRRLKAARQAVLDGTPPIRAMIWAAPENPEARVIADQYLLGDDLLVAPVLQDGQRERDIWLPPGQWRDYWTGIAHPAGWLRGFPAPLETLPLFERL